MRDPLALDDGLFDGVEAFLAKLDGVADLLAEEDRHGHPSLPEYDPAMGARYAVPGYAHAPLSVFRGEGVILWALVRALQPPLVGETFTGTGVSGCFLAAAEPTISVVTVDNYSEGTLGDTGWQHTQALRERLGVTNLVVVRGSLPEFDAVVEGRPIGLLFADGPHPPPRWGGVTVIHDEGSQYVDGFGVPGTSHMRVRSADPLALAVAAATVKRALDWLHGHDVHAS